MSDERGGGDVIEGVRFGVARPSEPGKFTRRVLMSGKCQHPGPFTFDVHSRVVVCDQCDVEMDPFDIINRMHLEMERLYAESERFNDLRLKEQAAERLRQAEQHHRAVASGRRFFRDGFGHWHRVRGVHRLKVDTYCGQHRIFKQSDPLVREGSVSAVEWAAAEPIGDRCCYCFRAEKKESAS